MNHVEMNKYRSAYQELIEEAARVLGWTSKDLLDRMDGLPEYYQAQGESKPQAWCSAARETITVEQERRDS